MHTISTILLAQTLLILARLAVTSFFWISAFGGLLNFRKTVEGVANMGLPMPAVSASAVIAWQFAGSALIVFDVCGIGWIGAGMLVIFTIMTIPLGHPFWKFDGARRTAEFHISLEHLTVIGGLMLAAILSGRP